MTEEFSKMLRVFEKIGDVSEDVPLYKNGKPSKFVGSLKSSTGSKNINMGLLHYDWNRSIGVDKITQAMRLSEKAGFDGAFIVGKKFSRSAVEQAYRINETSDKRIFLMDTEEISTAFSKLP
ncbi:MAG: hypothetical protein OEZ01_07210 [Candidatus Heimdallarchaeota archaeon]|nr:hypothetical protein [Candidatus Heimdallarchaeota archaeon]MDH5645778.1 hypothetical protein [Candidatus Heimdallarchaeota archaeon]